MPAWANCMSGKQARRCWRLRIEYWGISKGPWLCELIAGVSWMEDFASNRILHAA